MDPLLIDVPERIETERLVLRVPRAGDGAAVNEAIRVSLAELAPWLPWARRDADASTSRRRTAGASRRASSCARTSSCSCSCARPDRRARASCVGAAGLHRIDWTRAPLRGRLLAQDRLRAAAASSPRRWSALGRLAFDTLGARRVEIRMDDANVRSSEVAERAGFTLEAVLRFDSLTPQGEPRTTRVYARVRGAEEPLGAAPAPGTDPPAG